MCNVLRSCMRLLSRTARTTCIAGAVAIAPAASGSAADLAGHTQRMEAAAPSDAELCLRATRAAEEARRIPTKLLQAIAMVESGVWRQETGARTPWPWTVQAQGKGRYLPSKEDAVEHVRELLRNGVTNIDVGCMQVNLYHHGIAFSSLEEAFDPVNNVAYATSFLLALRQEGRSWSKAVRYYHSRNWRVNLPYKQRVQNAWQDLKTRDRTVVATAAAAAEEPPSGRPPRAGASPAPDSAATSGGSDNGDAGRLSYLKTAQWPPQGYAAQKQAEIAARVLVMSSNGVE